MMDEQAILAAAAEQRAAWEAFVAADASLKAALARKDEAVAEYKAADERWCKARDALTALVGGPP